MSVDDAKETFFADFNIYTSMAHYVAKELHMRPNDILDSWGVPELIVAYGHYANVHSAEIYDEWSQYDAQTRAKLSAKNGVPKEFAVKFYGVKQLT